MKGRRKMFGNLVESGSHAKDYARRSSFLIGTLGVYALLFCAGSIASIYAYDARLGRENLDFISLVSPPLLVPAAEPPRTQNTPPLVAANQPNNALPTRPVMVDDADTPRLVPDKTNTTPNAIPPAPRNAVIGDRVFDPVGSRSVGINNVNENSHNSNSGPVAVVTDAPPPAPRPASTPRPIAKIISIGVIEGKAISKPAPPYPAIARSAHVSGAVTVQVIVDEAGKVISAKAVSGHPLLSQAATQAAYQARFSPTLLSKVPVKVSGIITYNFVLQ